MFAVRSRSCVGEQDDDFTISYLPSSTVGGNFIILSIIWLSVIETNRDRFSSDRDKLVLNLDTCFLDHAVIKTTLHVNLS